MLAVASASAAAFRVEAPRQVIEGQKFMVTFWLDNYKDIPTVNPEMRNVPNCKYLYGPGISKSCQKINEKEVYAIGYSFIYKALKAGEIKIGSIKIKIKDKTITSKSIKLNICPSNNYDLNKE